MAPGPLLRRHRVALVLGALWVVHVVANAVWLTMDQTPMSGFEDQSSHYSSLLFLTAKLGLGHTGEGLAFLLREVSISYPVLSFSCHALAGLLFGPSRLVFCLANAAYLVPLLWGTYEIGRLCRGRGAGLLAAALVSLMPAVYGGARHLGVDFNALCLLPLAMVSLLHCDGFRDLRASALLGLTAGVAVLAKVSVLFFLMGPVTLVFAVSLGRAVRRGPRGTLRRVLAGAAVAATAAAVTTSPWWFGRLQQLVSVTGHFTVDAHTPEMSLSEALELCLSSWPFLHSWPLALCALLALPLFLWRGRHRLEVLCWATVPLLVYPVLFSGSMPVPFMVDRYLFPLAPAAAVILGVGIVSLPRFQVTASCVILGLAVALWISCSFYPRQNQLGSCGTRAPDPRPLFARLATCGRCNYAGLSERPDAHGCNTFDTRRAGDELVRWLDLRHPGGQGALIHVDGEIIGEDGDRLMRAEAMLEMMVRVQRLLPGARFVLGQRWALRDGLSPPGWQRYVLHYQQTMAPPPPAGPVRAEALNVLQGHQRRRPVLDPRTAQSVLRLPEVINRVNAGQRFSPQLYLVQIEGS